MRSRQVKSVGYCKKFRKTDPESCWLQSVKELQRELVSKSCELSAAQLDLHCWKQKAAVQQLRLVSVQEDLGHQKVHTEALASECSRRQEECNVAQAQLQAATAQNGQLESELSQSASAIADAKVSLQPPRHVDVVPSGDFTLLRQCHTANKV